MARYLGVDLHRGCFTVCTLAENGRKYLKTWQLKELEKFVQGLRTTDEVAVEVTGNTRLFHEAIKGHVKRVVVVNPSEFKVICQSVKKTDKNDARTLAVYLSKDMLPEVRMKDKAYANIASLTTTRDMLVKQRTRAKNKINNLLSAWGVDVKKEALGSEKGLEEVLGYMLDAITDLQISVLVDEIRNLNANIARLEDVIKREGAKLKGHKNLKSIKGIGDIGASILLSVIGGVENFEDIGKLSAYFGIVPRISNSNEKEHSGRITKRGSKLGRTTLVQCALIAKRYSGYLSSYYERIKARRGTGKAIIALARKFLGVIYETLKKDLIWEDFAHGVLA